MRWFCCRRAEELDHLLREHSSSLDEPLFVQIAGNDEAAVRHAAAALARRWPHAHMVGMAGPLPMAGEANLAVGVASMTSSTVSSLALPADEFDRPDGLAALIAEAVVRHDTTLLLLFTNHRSALPPLLRHLPLANERMVIIGCALSEGSVLFSPDGWLERGGIAVSFSGTALRGHCAAPFLWEPIGLAFSITKSRDQQIDELNGQKASSYLERYLGKEFTERLPFSGMEFPFLIERNGRDVCLPIVAVNQDGSVAVRGHVHNGEKVRFAYIHAASLYWSARDVAMQTAKQPAEGMLLYYSAALGGYTRPLFDGVAAAFGQAALFPAVEVLVKDAYTAVRPAAFAAISLAETAASAESGLLSPWSSPPEGMMTLAQLMSTSSRDMERLHVRLQMSEQRYKSLFEHNTDIVYSTDLHGRLTSVNPAFEQVLGYKKEEILYTNSLKYIHPNDIPRVTRYFYRALQGNIQTYNLEIPTKSGERLLFQMKNIPIIVDGKKVGIYGIGRNITEQKKAEEKISYLAYYDIDTNLPNRTKWMELFSEQLDKAKQKRRKMAVALIDLDRFKWINDSVGHYAGDDILRQLVERIRRALPPSAELGRFHGDKFCLLFPLKTEAQAATEAALRIVREVARPIVYDGKEFFVTASVGLAMFPDDGEDEHALLRHADMAVNMAKKGGGNRVERYCAQMNEEAMHRLEMGGHLRRAIEENELFLCYQPIVDVHTGAVKATEALIRWRHPKLGLVRPDEFIPLAEETGLIHEIGRWVLKTACRQTKQWQEITGNNRLSIFVNVSPVQFQHERFVDNVKQALKQSRLSPSCLHLELTEHSMLRYLSSTMRTMDELRKLGVGIAVDDFGSGYSSFHYLKRLPATILKIDRAFIEQLHANASDEAIVKAMITMGHGLGLETIAEGVETPEQLNRLRDLQCTYAQGYVFCPPLLAEEVMRYVTEKQK
ncbi:diguanylate cyclase/phosphodiesterase with PAS/PAC sensors [Geobacillus kaustophilus GBlys]|uniref:Diguanylate cyclase/phosphodiesterase with PAS/PAC sensors n=3 Tax=Geobacillus TaxID=129337 RepID=U2X6N5_GEOKU|nr:EAL domain-containing protein [Geobacillus kaustophilus]GAD14442.1 diguanylate cyclase/phosphodiesterase with PAS/PAC sensors [Geobacillus kaustophilus GBlys]